MENTINNSIYHKLANLIPNLSEHLASGTDSGMSGKPGITYDFLAEESPGEYIIALESNRAPGDTRLPDTDIDIRIIPEREFAQAISLQNGRNYMNVEGQETVGDLQRDLDAFLDSWLALAIEHGHRIELAGAPTQTAAKEIERDSHARKPGRESSGRSIEI